MIQLQIFNSNYIVFRRQEEKSFRVTLGQGGGDISDGTESRAQRVSGSRNHNHSTAYDGWWWCVTKRRSISTWFECDLDTVLVQELHLLYEAACHLKNLSFSTPKICADVVLFWSVKKSSFKERSVLKKNKCENHQQDDRILHAYVLYT